MTVATAAPFTPIENTKMKSGSRMIFETAPIITAIMPTEEYPRALMNGVSVSVIRTGMEPIT